MTSNQIDLLNVIQIISKGNACLAKFKEQQKGSDKSSQARPLFTPTGAPVQVNYFSPAAQSLLLGSRFPRECNQFLSLVAILKYSLRIKQKEKTPRAEFQSSFKAELQLKLHDLCCLWNSGFIITKSKGKLQKQLRTHF